MIGWHSHGGGAIICHYQSLGTGDFGEIGIHVWFRDIVVVLYYTYCSARANLRT
jgi:hypothetical protein